MVSSPDFMLGRILAEGFLSLDFRMFQNLVSLGLLVESLPITSIWSC